MQLGIFAKTFVRPTVEANLDAVRDAGFTCVQYNLACAGLPTLPDELDPALCERIRRACVERNVTLSAVSGTFNIIDPNRERRRRNVARLRTLAENCGLLGTSIITLCSGTCDPENMWRHHPDNGLPRTWAEVTEAMRELAQIGEQTGVTMAFEPEVSNVVDSARKARRLLDEVGSPNLKVVLDGANLFHTGELPRMREILAEACELLGADTVIVHAKDLNRDGDAGDVPAGCGLLDYDYYLSLLRKAKVQGPLITHGLKEEQVPACVAFLRKKLDGHF
jgi:sugar phosphate isomerase/epimerase